jgi:uncharacterized membrane protein YuzA (DUF378 family)
MFDRFESADATYYKKLLFKIAMVLIIVGALNWLSVGAVDINIVSLLFGEKTLLTNIIYIIVGLSAILVMFDRDTYLPFLGPMVAPCSVLEDRAPPGYTRTIQVKVAPNSKVIYWASEPATENLKKINNWKNAYLTYQNAGVTTSNSDGIAMLKIRDPQPYVVPIMGKLKPHVHYRVCGESGWMGRIQTTFVEEKIDGLDNFEIPLNI